MLNVIKYRKIFYFISGILILISIFSMIFFGFKFNIEFTGGSLLEGEYKTIKPSNEEILNILNQFNLKDVVIQSTENQSLILKFSEVNENIHQQIKNFLNELGIKINKENVFQEHRFESIGPMIGSELKRKSMLAIFLILLLIIIYITYAFRKVSYPVKSWRYGVTTVITLFHDILIPLGVFSLLSHYKNVEIQASFIAAFLTVVGYSVHDTIVVFDRIRENLFKNLKMDFGEVINKSINQTLWRSINTSLTVLLALLAIYFVSGATLKYFSLILLIGIGIGTYSSIFIASPLLYSWVLKKKS